MRQGKFGFFQSTSQDMGLKPECAANMESGASVGFSTS